MAVSAVQNNHADLVAALNGAGGQQARTGIAEVEDRFLKLLVTQLRNQDPMNPMQNAELTMQLAQMSTVEGINRMNAGLETLLSGFRASQTLQAAGLIGHQVFVEGDRLSLSGGLAGGGVELAQAAERVTVNILDGYGAVVRSLELGALPEGLNSFVWDGRDALGNALPDGQYRFTVSARQGTEAVSATALNLARVASVGMRGGELSIELAGQGSRSLGELKQIF